MKKYFRICLIVAGILVCFAVLLVALYLGPAKNAYRYGLQGKDAFLQAQNQLLAQDFKEAGEALAEASRNFASAQQEFKKFRWLEIIPWFGWQLSAVDNLFSAGLKTAESLEKIDHLVIAITEPLQKDTEISLAALSEEETRQLLASVYTAKPALEEAKKAIDEAGRYVDKIPKKGVIKRIKAVIQPLQERVPQLQQAIDQAISASQIIPSIAGYPTQKTYLFLLQNNTEMRPTGGFIGTYGILKIKDGNITYFKTDNTYNLDQPSAAWLNVEPPWPFTRYNKVFQWFLRDANWSPDFPTTAQKAEWFYHQERGQENDIDGIIAITPTFIQSLLELTGNITVDGLTFKPDNLIDTLQYQVDQGFLRQGIAESERKEIIGSLSEKLLDRVLSLPKSRWPDLWKTFAADIAEKQILLYTKDTYVQNFITKENWGGEIRSVDYDYVAVIDANLASLKSDPGVKRTITYTVRRDGKNLIADVTIHYRNEGTLTWKTTRYRSYTRVYVPAGATLLQSTGSMVDCKLTEAGSVETNEELNKTVFGAFICIEPGAEGSLSFKYRLPSAITNQFENGAYHLLFQKQAGAAAHALTVNINLKKNIKAVEHIDNASVSNQSELTTHTSLSQDKEILITY